MATRSDSRWFLKLERGLLGLPLGPASFWSCNVLLALLGLFGLAPVLGPVFARELWRGLLPPDLALALLVLVVLPPAAMLLGRRLRRDRRLLVRAFFGLELPLYVAAAFRLVLVRELTMPLGVLFLALGLGLAAFAVDVFREPPSPPSRLEWVRLGGLSALVALEAYLAVLALFYAVPLAALVVQELVDGEWARVVADLAQHPGKLLAALVVVTVLGAGTMLATALPIFVALLHWGAFLRQAVRQRNAGGWASALAPPLVALLALGLAYAAVPRPHERLLALPSADPTTDDERRARLSEADELRAGLLDAFLAERRYFGEHSSEGIVRSICAEALAGYDSCASLQRAHDLLASPLLYRGDLRGDGRLAAARYARFFDAPVTEREHDAVVTALGATFLRDGPESTLLDRDGEHVLLAAQRLEVTERGDFAEVELHETYLNRTPDQQEVSYHFSLPESASITGVWLGEGPDREDAFAAIVAPRGAARQVYRDEVRARIDPALLEQVGPHQYRLRVFPIPAARGAGAQPMHLWLRYTVLASAGTWPMPALLERRNVFWGEDTERLHRYAGQAYEERTSVEDEAWLPAALPVRRAAVAAAHDVTIDRWRVRAEPLEPVPQRLPPGRYLVVVDRSYSMGAHAGALGAAIAELRRELGPEHDVQALLTAAGSRGESPRQLPLAELEPGSLVFYGGQALSEQLAQIDAETPWTAVLVLTDDGGYRLEPETPSRPSLRAPLWLVHVAGPPPLGYADAVNDLLVRPTSGAASSVREAVDRFALARASGARATNGYLWSVAELTGDEGPEAAAPEVDAAFTPLAARALVDWLAGEDPAPLLGTLHDLAVETRIVTPFSSMIVLVNERQRLALDRAAAGDGAFARASDDPLPAMVTGVPEPETWALGLAALALLLLSRRARAAG